MQFDVEAKEMGEKHWLPKASNGSLETSKSSTPKNGEIQVCKNIRINIYFSKVSKINKFK